MSERKHLRIKRRARMPKRYLVFCKKSHRHEWHERFVRQPRRGDDCVLEACSRSRAQKFSLAEARDLARRWSLPNLGKFVAVCA